MNTDPGASRTPSRTRSIAVGLLALGLVAVVVVVARTLRRRAGVVAQTAAGIEADLAAVDPVERAAVLARLAKDAARDVRARRHP
jgi:hypothetical protein